MFTQRQMGAQCPLRVENGRWQGALDDRYCPKIGPTGFGGLEEKAAVRSKGNNRPVAAIGRFFGSPKPDAF